MNDEQKAAMHALVCNAFGYDKSLVRALALRARKLDPELSERVLAVERAASLLSPCHEAHPISDAELGARSDPSSAGTRA